MTDLAARLATAVEAGDADDVLAVVESADWRAMDAAEANVLLRQVALYGYSGRTQRYAEAVRAMRAGGCEPDLASCALLGDNERAAQILSAYPDALDQADASGATALHHAAERGNAALVAELCQRGADVNAVDQHGRMALEHALHAGPWKTGPATEVVALLRRHGATVDFWTLAALGDAGGLVAMLEDGLIGVDEHNADGRTALFQAARNNHLAAVIALLDAGADPNCACADGQTTLYTACLHMLSQECDVEIVRALVAHGAEVTLPAAIVLEDLDLVRTLAARDPAVLAGQDHDTPLGYAIHAWRPRALACLIDVGARPNAANWGHIERIARDDALVQDLRRRAATGGAQ
ncbi:MAG: ankyrin repeat domain-containing protein [Gammaproteobacteria bacterium]|nr:ankyrin repeat domain-containing protein [Gammaproteobacteria bacterium]